MSIPNPAAGRVPSHAGDAPSPAGSQHAASQQAGAPMPVVRPKRPPLPPSHRRAALRAGAFGNGLIGLGLLLIWGGLGLVYAAVLMQLALLMERTSEESTTSEVAELEAIVDRLWAFVVSPLGIAIMVVAVLLGVAVIVLGILLSTRILRRAGVHRAAGVTWSGAGILRGVGVLLGGIFEQPALMVAFLPVLVAGRDVLMVTEAAFAAEIESFVGIAIAIVIALGVILVLVSVAAQAAIGMLLSWWMAHALRGWGAQATDASTGDPSTAHREPTAAAAPASVTAPPAA